MTTININQNILRLANAEQQRDIYAILGVSAMKIARQSESIIRRSLEDKKLYIRIVLGEEITDENKINEELNKIIKNMQDCSEYKIQQALKSDTDLQNLTHEVSHMHGEGGYQSTFGKKKKKTCK